MYTLSVIIIVKNDRGIKNTLDTIAVVRKPAQTEVIVIDVSEPSVLKDIRDSHPEVAWYYYENKTGKKLTRSEQRNMGIEKASGDIIVFIDANCVPVEEWLEELCRPILKGEEQITSGSVRALNPVSVNNLASEYDTMEYLPESATINLAFLKKIVDTVGFFDTDFLYGADVDFTWRAIDAGYKIKFVPQAVVYHEWGDCREEVSRSLKYGIARARLYKKHLKRLPHVFGYDIRTFAYPAFLIGLPLVVLFPWYMLLLLIPLYNNRRTMPFKTTFLSLIYGAGIIRGIFS